MGTAPAAPVAVVGAHPLADRFPMLCEDALERLAADIRANGQKNPVVVNERGLILDGRNRHAACQMLGRETRTALYEGTEESEADYILSANVHRRHQSTGSLAMSTALVLADAGRRENGRWKRGSVVGNPESGTTSKVWQNAMQQAGVVLDHAPELAEQVVSGGLALDSAYRQAEQRRDVERQQLEREERLAAEEADAKAFIEETAPDLASRVDGNDLQSYVEARDLWNRRNREEAERLRREKSEAEKKAAEERQALTQYYTGIAKAVQVIADKGGNANRAGLMDRYDPSLLDPPIYAREFELPRLHEARDFIDALIQWKESP